MKLTIEFMTKLRLAVVHYPPSHSFPAWILSSADSTTASSSGNFLSITRTSEELSLVCPETIVPASFEINDDQKVERGWVYFKVCGPLQFEWTGILAGLSSALAAADISIFAISTYDTDYILVKENVGEKAASVLEELGHTVKKV